MMEFALNTHCAAMCNDYVFHNRKSQTGPTGPARPGLVDAIEALKEPREMLGGDARPGIAYEEFDIVFPPVCSDHDRRSRRTILHRVRNEVGEDLMYGFRIGLHHCVLDQLDG